MHRLAKGLDRAFGYQGPIFEHRYHDTQITTARQARNSLAYVLNNWRRHREDFANGRELPYRLDPYASGIAFDGWSKRSDEAHPAWPVAPPQTALLRTEWEWLGRIDHYETPGAVRI